MTAFSESFPILSTPDLARALAFYRDAMGSRETYRFPTEGEPAFVVVELPSGQLGLAADPDAGRGGPFALCVYADDCDAAVAHLRGHGARVLTGPADQPWGERMARLADPDGNEIVLVSRT